VRKPFSLTLALTALLTANVLPALADGGDTAKEAAMFPVKAASMGTGMVIGVPVAITRRASNRCIEYTQSFADKIGGKENIPPMMFAMILGVPFGLLVGTGEGVYAGGKNAIEKSCEQPFSLDSMSLGDDLEAPITSK